MNPLDADYLTPAQVARQVQLSPRTIARWATLGLLPCIVTPDGHQRFRPKDVEDIRRRTFGSD